MINEWMQKLSQELELDPPLKEESQGNYILAIDEDHHVHIRETDLGYRFFCDINPLPNLPIEDLLIRLMHGNLFGQGTYGAVLGFNPDENTVCAHFNDPYSTEYGDFKDKIEDFINCIDFWAQEIKEYGYNREV